MKGLIIGLANDQSLAWGCAAALKAAGADLAVTYQNDKARPHVEPLAEAAGASIVLPLDVRDAAGGEPLQRVPTGAASRVDIDDR